MEKSHLGVCLIEQVSVHKLESLMRWKQQAESVHHPSVESITYKDTADFCFGCISLSRVSERAQQLGRF